MKHVIGELQQIRLWARAMLIAHRASLLLSWTIMAIFALIVFDFFVRLPGTLRLIMLLAGVGVVGWSITGFIRHAVLFWPSLTQIALRVEKTLPSLKGRLASSLEFVTAGLEQTNTLAARSVDETSTRLQGESVRQVLAPKRALRDITVMASSVALAILLTIANPATASTGLMRLFLPLSDTYWPARTGVASLMHEILGGMDIYPSGAALPLRVQVTKGAEDQIVNASYRVLEEGRFGNWKQIVLTHQSNGVQERLVDINAEEIEFFFQTTDSQTSRERIRLIPPPALIGATLVVSPPGYASGRVPEYEAQLGPGIDDRAMTERSSLIGSQVMLRLELNKPLPVPDHGEDLSTWVDDTFGWSTDESPLFSFDPDQPTIWTLRWKLSGTRTINPVLEDEYGLGNSEPISYRIDAIDDFAPRVIITEPQTDEIVLASAVVRLVSEATDDVAVSWVGLEAAVDFGGVEEEQDTPAAWSKFRDVDALTATIEAELDLSRLGLAEGDVVLVTGVAQDMFELDGERHETARSSVRRLRVISELELATQLRRQLSAVRHNAIRIETHQSELQDDVIESGVQPGTDRGQSQISDRIETQLQQVHEISELMQRNQLQDSQLQELLRQSEDLLDFAGRASSRAGELIKQREADQADQVGQTSPEPSIESEADTPREGTEQGEDESRDSSEASSQQGRPTQAEQDSDRTGQSRSGDQTEGTEWPEGAQDDSKEEDRFGSEDFKEPAEDDRQIVEQQQEVRNELADLIELLDRDEDTWVITRQIKTLLDEQTRLASETEELGRETLGQTREELSRSKKSELDRIRDKQMELRDRARQIIDSARQRAEALESNDPQAAEGMRAAADEAEQRELDRDMEQAAQRAAANRMQQASNSQQRSIETLKRMLEKMEETKRAKAEQLLRQLASLIESIKRLITIQENELTELSRAIHANDFTNRDRAMIRLNQNTQAVAAEARVAGSVSRRIARTMDRAADAQGAAITALRTEPVNGEQAEVAENKSLELLNHARELAEELQEQTQAEETSRRREELIEAYRDYAEQEAALRQESLKLAERDELNRRQLVEARRQGSTQERIRSGLADLRNQTTELKETAIFSLVHRLIDQWAREVSDDLVEGVVNENVTASQRQIVESIGRLIAALEETLSPPDEFAQDQQNQQAGGSSQGQQQSLIPAVAELKLLQGMQEQVYKQTRNIDGRTGLDEAQRRSRMRGLGRQQRELLDVGREMIERLQEQMVPQAPAKGTDEPNEEATDAQPE